MKFPKSVSSPWMWLFTAGCFIFLAVTGCSKKADSTAPSPKLSAEDAKQQRLAWNLKTTVQAYEQAGFSNPDWDEPAKRALKEFARVRAQCIEPDEPWTQIIATNCSAAVEAGCGDPMIAYLYIRCSMSQTNSPKDFVDAFCTTAEAMQKSSYPSIRKFYVWQRTGQQVHDAYGYGTNIPLEFARIGIFSQGVSTLLEALSDKTIPPQEFYDASHEILEVWKNSKAHYGDLYHSIEKLLPDNWSNDPIVLLLKGEAYIHMAWVERGGGYADTVTDEGWKLFRERLAIAEEALNRAWKLNPKDPHIPLAFISVELGQGQGRERMELWFQRAMELDPSSYDACWSKAYYLEPKWHGSAEDMIEFGRECVRAQNWKGRVPLILVDVHSELVGYLEKSEQAGYWKRPEVWPDIKAAYERFFELNPKDIGFYHNYVRYAYQAEQWDALNELIPKLGPVNYAFFGGKDEFDKMVRLAKEHTSKSKTAEQN